MIVGSFGMISFCGTIWMETETVVLGINVPVKLLGGEPIERHED